MKMQEIYIVEPSTSEEAKALRAFAKALKIKITKQNNLDSIDNFERHVQVISATGQVDFSFSIGLI
ncbi:hypothetical protein OBK24_09205 [Empedobacter falsenii]